MGARRTLPLVGERMGRRVQGRVAVPPSLPLGIERTVLVRSGSSGSASGTFRVEWQCDSHCHSVVSVLGSAPYTATRRRAYRIGTFRGEWQCDQYARERAAARPTLPLGIERTVSVRSGSSGSATGTFGVEWQCGSHCHSLVNVQGLSVQCRVAVRPVCSGVVWPRMSGSALDLSRGWPFTRGISWQAGRFLN